MLVADLHRLKALLSSKEVDTAGWEALARCGGEDRDLLDQLSWLTGPRKERPIRAVLRHIDNYLASIRRNGTAVLEAIDLRHGPTDRDEHWGGLIDLCRDLERLSRKQLEGRLAKDHNDFIEGYGQRLAHLTFYFREAHRKPRDDAPRVADVFTSLNGDNERRYLHVAVGRPRALWVLYPWRGREILCRGAVLGYHEFQHPTRLDDDEWRRLEHSAAPPAWLAPLLRRASE